MSKADSDKDLADPSPEQMAAELRRTAAALIDLANKLAGQPAVIAEGKTPQEWVDLFAARGIEVSERTLRERARALGAYRILGHTMLLMPEHIDQVWEQPAPSGRKVTEQSDREARTTQRQR